MSHDPAAIPSLVGALATHDVVLGSRYIGGIRILNRSISRLFLSLFANGYVHLLLRTGLTDATTGFRAYRASALRRINYRLIPSRGYSFLVEMVWAAQRNGLSVIEVPIVYTERRAGKSKMSRKVIAEASLCPIRLLLKNLICPESVTQEGEREKNAAGSN